MAGAILAGGCDYDHDHHHDWDHDHDHDWDHDHDHGHEVIVAPAGYHDHRDADWHQDRD
jgi:protein OS-9